MVEAGGTAERTTTTTEPGAWRARVEAALAALAGRLAEQDAAQADECDAACGHLAARLERLERAVARQEELLREVARAARALVRAAEGGPALAAGLALAEVWAPPLARALG